MTALEDNPKPARLSDGLLTSVQDIVNDIGNHVQTLWERSRASFLDGEPRILWLGELAGAEIGAWPVAVGVTYVQEGWAGKFIKHEDRSMVLLNLPALIKVSESRKLAEGPANAVFQDEQAFAVLVHELIHATDKGLRPLDPETQETKAYYFSTPEEFKAWTGTLFHVLEASLRSLSIGQAFDEIQKIEQEMRRHKTGTLVKLLRTNHQVSVSRPIIDALSYMKSNPKFWQYLWSFCQNARESLNEKGRI